MMLIRKLNLFRKEVIVTKVENDWKVAPVENLHE